MATTAFFLRSGQFLGSSGSSSTNRTTRGLGVGEGEETRVSSCGPWALAEREEPFSRVMTFKHLIKGGEDRADEQDSQCEMTFNQVYEGYYFYTVQGRGPRAAEVACPSLT